MAGPASSYCLFMVDADAMRLPKIIQRGLFADQPVATFSTTPGTDDFHNHLSYVDRSYPVSSARITPSYLHGDTDEK